MTIPVDYDSLPSVPKKIITKAGTKVDFESDLVNVLENVRNKNFRFGSFKNSYLKYSVKLFLGYSLQAFSVLHSKNFEHYLVKYFCEIEELNNHNLEKIISSNIEKALVELRGTNNEYALWYLKYWYIWCESMGLPYFDSDFAMSLDSIKISGNEKGNAVLSLDRSLGPLDTNELTDLIGALESCNNTDKIFEKTLTYLYLTLGCNSSNITLLHWEDFEVVQVNEMKVYFLKVPRIKKRLSKHREEFKRRELDSRLGRIIEQYREYSICDKIMFAKKRGKYLKGSTSQLISSYCKSDLGLNFHVTARRLRYTFATRLVMNGVSKEKLADLLDHSDLQHVQVYYDLRHKIKDFLSEAESKELGSIFKRFMGEISDKSEVGDIKFSYLDSEEKPVLGKCGSDSMCELNPPYSCFVCSKFKAFSDSLDTYKKILAYLVKWSKDRNEEYGENDRIHSLMLDVQMALGDLIRRIESA